jgi:octaprenyl-diphosphate synthase
MLQLAELYSPIADDLAASEALFRDELISDQGFISDLCHHVAQFHGKRVRPALLLLTAKACGNVDRAHHVLAAVVEMVHIATLVHDDILDEADIRRRAATVNRLWGNERAVLMGDFLISHAFHLCSSLHSQEASRLIGATTNTVCEGELMQVANRYNFELSEELYLDIITRKTASLIGVCGTLGARYADANETVVAAMQTFGESLGVAFQITDDVLDLLGDEAEVGKSLGRDVEEGKLTLPLIHYLRNISDTKRAEVAAIIGNGHANKAATIARMLRKSDSLDYAFSVAESYVSEARNALDHLPASDAKSCLTEMTHFVLRRER